MKQITFHGRVLLPLSVFAEARAGDPLTMERILRYYDGYMNKLCRSFLYTLIFVQSKTGIFSAAVQPLSSGASAPRNPGSIWPGWTLA